MRTRKNPPRGRPAQASSGTIAGETLEALAKTVRAARERRSWTLNALAARSGLSKGMLLQIEGARTNPSIGTLIRIANAFGVSVWQLFASPEDAIRVAEPADAITLWRSRKGGSARLLLGSESPQPVELWDWRLVPGDVYQADAHFDTTVELIQVHKGTLTLVVGRHRANVRAGGSAVARMNEPHQYRNDSGAPVTFTMVVVDPR